MTCAALQVLWRAGCVCACWSGCLTQARLVRSCVGKGCTVHQCGWFVWHEALRVKVVPHGLWPRHPSSPPPAITHQFNMAPMLPTDHLCFPLLLLSALHQTVANFFLAFEQDLALVPVLNKVDLPSADPPAVAAQMASAFDVDPHQVSPPHPGASLSCGTSWHANTTQRCRHTPVTRPTRQANAGCLFPGLILPAADRHTPAPYGPGALPSHADAKVPKELLLFLALLAQTHASG